MHDTAKYVGVIQIMQYQRVKRHFVSTEVRRQSEGFKMEINKTFTGPKRGNIYNTMSKNFSFNILVFEVG